jgi:hemoglobin
VPDDAPINDQVTIYEAAGGMAFFTRLVDIFYREVEADPVLLSLYPEPHDLGPARERFTLFLAQYWGGPTTYDDMRGHPRLRMRHAPFVIGEAERDHWLAAMRIALDETNPAPVLREKFDEYFTTTAEAMRNNGLKRLI